MILGSSGMMRESQLVYKDATLIQQRRDSSPLRGRNLEARTCVLNKRDAIVDSSVGMKGRGLVDTTFESAPDAAS